MTPRRPETVGHDPAAIAAVVASHLPGADTDRLAAQIAALELLPAHARGLVAYLQTHPDALTSGEANGPSALRRLLEVLAAEHPTVQPMRCHRCGAQTRLPYRVDGASICGNCYRQTHLKVCVRCGQTGQPAFREGGGIVCTRCGSRDLTRRRACARCGALARVAYRVDGEPLCQKCGPRKLYTCSSCGRENRAAHAITTRGPICSLCYHRSREHQCVRCGRITVEARVADRDAGTWICNRCWIPPIMTCASCGHLRPCARGNASGRPVCGRCRSRVQRPKVCSLCSRRVAIQTTLPLGPVCGPCYRRLRRNPGICASCQQIRPLVGVNDAGSICGPCTGDTRNWVCAGCGKVDLLIGGTHCLACTVRTRVNDLLAGPDGKIPTQLGGVATMLLEHNTPEQTREVLNGARWMQLLGELVARGELITHTVLDEFDQDLHVRHLREVLVYAGALDEQRDSLETLEPWMNTLLSGVSSGIAAVLRPYASWSVLARARRRASRGLQTTSTPDYVRARIIVAQQFLGWLEDNQIALGEATQHDVNTWLALGASTRHRLRDFLQWAHARGLASKLEVRWLGSQGPPEQVLDDDTRWALLRRCLRDDSLQLRLRVAGALVLLYGQTPSRIVELTAASITTAGSNTYLALRDQPVLLPPPLAGLISQLAALNRPTISRPDTPTWLFPGLRIGSHLYDGSLTRLLNKKLGVFVRPARGAALSALAADLPAPVLAELLGISISTATLWVALAARDDADYLAARIAKPPKRPDNQMPMRA